MDKILTMHNWWDGPLLGLTTFQGEYCIFEKVFDVEQDEYSIDEFFLTPITEKEAEIIIKNWEYWRNALNSGNTDQYYDSPNGSNIETVLKSSPKYRHYFVRGGFHYNKSQCDAYKNSGKRILSSDICNGIDCYAAWTEVQLKPERKVL